jgi:hypothetical protein
MPFEYGGQTWPDTPFVSRTREIELLHETPDDVNFYKCQWTDGTNITSFRERPVWVERSSVTFVMVKDEDGSHTGTLRMALVPGQPGEIRCKAGVYKDPEAASIALDMTAYQTWEAAHPGEQLNLDVLWSEWSNPVPIGTVEPNPVPEPGVTLLLIAGLIGLVVMGWRRKTR